MFAPTRRDISDAIAWSLKVSALSAIPDLLVGLTLAAICGKTSVDMGSGSTRHISATVGANIQAARKDAGLTQHELAVKLGRVDAMAVSRWERAVHRPNDMALLRLAEVLERSVPWFYTEHERKAA
jgi:DNA-binding transcriptional regulator YiaG